MKKPAQFQISVSIWQFLCPGMLLYQSRDENDSKSWLKIFEKCTGKLKNKNTRGYQRSLFNWETARKDRAPTLLPQGAPSWAQYMYCNTSYAMYCAQFWTTWGNIVQSWGFPSNKGNLWEFFVGYRTTQFCAPFKHTLGTTPQTSDARRGTAANFRIACHCWFDLICFYYWKQ